MPTKAEADIKAGGSARARTRPDADPLLERVVWREGTDPDYPYLAAHAGEQWLVRLNDFPDESLFTLIVDGVEVGDFDDWPPAWERP